MIRHVPSLRNEPKLRRGHSPLSLRNEPKLRRGHSPLSLRNEPKLRRGHSPLSLREEPKLRRGHSPLLLRDEYKLPKGAHPPLPHSETSINYVPKVTLAYDDRSLSSHHRKKRKTLRNPHQYRKGKAQSSSRHRITSPLPFPSPFPLEDLVVIPAGFIQPALDDPPSVPRLNHRGHSPLITPL